MCATPTRPERRPDEPRDRVVRQELRRREPRDVRHHRRGGRLDLRREGRDLPRVLPRPDQRERPLPRRRSGGSRGGRLRPHRGSDPGPRRRQEGDLDRGGGHGERPRRAPAERRDEPRSRRREVAHRRDRDLPGGDRGAGRRRDHERARRDQRGGLRRVRRSGTQTCRRACTRRPDRAPGHHDGRARGGPALRDLDRGLRREAAPPRSHLRRGGQRCAALLARHARWLDQDLRRRDPAENEGPGVSRARVREARPPDQAERRPAHARRGCDGRRQLRGHRPQFAIQRPPRREHQGLPHRGSERARRRWQGQELHRRVEAQPARGPAPRPLAGHVEGAAGPPLAVDP